MASKAKKFRIATEGATTDGRNIERTWLEQMAKNYKPAKFTARINLEHIKGYAPDSIFKRYGDVLALSTEEVDDGKLGLFAVIDPTSELIAMTAARQKVFTSMEVNPKFADTGEAYLVGLAVTDDPASLGTEMLQFSASAKNSPLASRKQNPENLFTEAVEFSLELEEEAKPSDEGKSLFNKVKELLSGKTKSDTAHFADHGAAIEAIAESQRGLLDRFSTLDNFEQRLNTVAADLKKDQDALAELTQKLSQSSDNRTHRPTATGGNNTVVTDC